MSYIKWEFMSFLSQCYQSFMWCGIFYVCSEEKDLFSVWYIGMEVYVHQKKSNEYNHGMTRDGCMDRI